MKTAPGHVRSLVFYGYALVCAGGREIRPLSVDSATIRLALVAFRLAS